MRPKKREMFIPFHTPKTIQYTTKNVNPGLQIIKIIAYCNSMNKPYNNKYIGCVILYISQGIIKGRAKNGNYNQWQ